MLMFSAPAPFRCTTYPPVLTTGSLMTNMRGSKCTHPPPPLAGSLPPSQPVHPNPMHSSAYLVHLPHRGQGRKQKSALQYEHLKRNKKQKLPCSTNTSRETRKQKTKKKKKKPHREQCPGTEYATARAGHQLLPSTPIRVVKNAHG